MPLRPSPTLILALAVAAAGSARAEGEVVALPDADPLAVLAAPVRRSPVDEAIAAGVPDGLARELSARAADAGLAPADALAPVTAAARAQLPAQLVAAKILEGLAKGAPPERVLAVAAALEQRLETADGLVRGAADAGLPLRGAREVALADLAGALGDGVAPEAVRALVEAARLAPGSGSGDSVVAAARTLGELSRRGVPAAEAMQLGAALAAHPPLPAGEVASLFDAWRSEAGVRDPRPFLREATRRAEAGSALTGIVDYFGESPDHVVRQGGRGPAADDGELKGSSSKAGGNQGQATTPPGLQDGPRGKAKGHGKK